MTYLSARQIQGARVRTPVSHAEVCVQSFFTSPDGREPASRRSTIVIVSHRFADCGHVGPFSLSQRNCRDHAGQYVHLSGDSFSRSIRCCLLALLALRVFENKMGFPIPMTNLFFDQPILTSKHDCTRRHWELDSTGEPTPRAIEARRMAALITPILKPQV